MQTRERDPDLTTLAIASEIRAELGRRNMTRAALAREMGVSQMWMSDRLNGKVEISLYELQLFATALHLHVTDLLPRAMLFGGPEPRWAELRGPWRSEHVVTSGGRGPTLQQHHAPAGRAPTRPPGRPAAAAGPGRTSRTRPRVAA